MKIKKFQELNEDFSPESDDQHHLKLIIEYLFQIQDNFTKLSNNPMLLKYLKNDLYGIIDRYDLKN